LFLPAEQNKQANSTIQNLSRGNALNEMLAMIQNGIASAGGGSFFLLDRVSRTVGDPYNKHFINKSPTGQDKLALACLSHSNILHCAGRRRQTLSVLDKCEYSNPYFLVSGSEACN